MNIGIDIGGKHTSIGLVDDEGNLLEKKDIYYDDETFDIEGNFEIINEFIKKHEHMIDSIGIGVPGLATDTFVNYTCNLPLTNIEITDLIKTRLPVYVTNDANCAVIAEYEFADKKMYSNYIMITVGTGIGAGIIINGSLYTGSTGTAGEIGHMVIEKDGLPCKCGRRGCLEKYASVSSLLKLLEVDSLKEVFYLSDKNNLIQSAVDDYLNNLAIGIANVINIYDPEIVVIGGGLADFEEFFIGKLKSLIASKLYNKYSCDLNIKVAKLKNDAGVIGASLISNYI